MSKSNIKPHKISYYLERKDPDFDEKMASVLHVYKEAAMINDKDLSSTEHYVRLTCSEYPELLRQCSSLNDFIYPKEQVQ